jgi:hypothetical protein
MLADGLDAGLTPGDSFLRDPACARELLLRGADPNASAPDRYSPLRFAMGCDGEENI